MNFEEILGGGYVVAADSWLNMIVVWNGSGTFNVWAHVEGDTYRNTDNFTRFVADAYSAKLAARKWLANVYDEMEQYMEAV